MEQVKHPVVTTGDFVVSILITMIPIVGIVMLFVWAFSSATNPSKANWAKACLIWIAISIFLTMMIFVVFAAVLGQAIINWL